MLQPEIKGNNNNRFQRIGSDYSFFRDKNSSISGYYLTNKHSLLKDFLCYPCNAIDTAELVKNSRTTTAGIVTIAAEKYFLKRYNNKGLIYSLKYMFRSSRPLNSLRVSVVLKALNVPCPEVFATLSCRIGPYLSASYLLTQYMSNLILPVEYLRKCSLEHKLTHEWQQSVCELMAKIHAEGIYHGDMKLSNIFFRNADDKIEFGLWDFDSTRIFNSNLSEYYRTMEVARLLSSCLIEFKNAQIKQVPSDFIADFIKLYEKTSGHRLAIKLLDSRINYLCNRKRTKIANHNAK